MADIGTPEAGGIAGIILAIIGFIKWLRSHDMRRITTLETKVDKCNEEHGNCREELGGLRERADGLEKTVRIMAQQHSPFVREKVEDTLQAVETKLAEKKNGNGH